MYNLDECHLGQGLRKQKGMEREREREKDRGKGGRSEGKKKQDIKLFFSIF